MISMEIYVNYNYSEEESKLMEGASADMFKKAVNASATELENILGVRGRDCETFSVKLLKDGQVIASN